MASSLELKRLITLRERENKMLREDLLETKNWIDMKMNQQIMLHDQMVVNHRQMLDKCKVYKEDLELANLENDRFKCIAQSLANKVEELTGNKIEKRSDHGYNDEYSDVKENGDTLMKELCVYKTRAEETYKELAVVNERLDEMETQLARSAETETCLRKCVDNLTAVADAERARQDAETRRIVGALNALIRAAKDDNRSNRLKLDVQRDLNDKLAAENDRLAAVLNKLDEVDVSLNERMVALQQRVSRSDSGGRKQRRRNARNDEDVRDHDRDHDRDYDRDYDRDHDRDRDRDGTLYLPRFRCADGHDANGRPRPTSESTDSYDFTRVPTENDEFNSTRMSLNVHEF